MTAKFLNEAFDASMGTQRAAMGDYKKLTEQSFTIW
jgi:hypothetical protein